MTVCGLFTIMILTLAKNIMPSLLIFLLPLLVLVALPLIRNKKRKAALEELHHMNMEPPVYYNSTNAQAIKTKNTERLV